MSRYPGSLSRRVIGGFLMVFLVQNTFSREEVPSVSSPVPELLDSFQEEVKEGPSESEEAELWALLGDIDEVLRAQMEQRSHARDGYAILARGCSNLGQRPFEAEALRSRSEESDSLSGLEFRGGYTNNAVTEDLASESAYLELSWDVLKNGYLEEKRRTENLSREAEIADLVSTKENNNLAHRCRRTYIHEVFSALIGNLLGIKQQLMQSVYEIERRAYFKGWSLYDDFLVAESDAHLLISDLSHMAGDSALDKMMATPANPPLLKIQIEEIINAIRNDDRDERVWRLQNEIHDANSVEDLEDRLRLFARKRFDLANSSRESEDIAVGLRFRVPLGGGSDPAGSIERERLYSELEISKLRRINQARIANIGYQDQLRRALRQQFRYVRAQERVRQSLVAWSHGEDVKPTVASTRVRSMIDAAIELARAKEVLYSRISSVFHAAEIGFKRELLKRTGVPETRFRSRFGDRALYLDSDAFNRLNNDEWFEVFRAKGINSALVSYRDGIKTGKLKAFIADSAGKFGVELVIGNSQWVYPWNHDKAIAATTVASDLAGSVHFNIEPHALESYRLNKETLLKFYVDLIRRARTELPDAKISVSVPTGWPVEIYEQVGQLTDQVYLALYGKSDIEARQVRLESVMKRVSAKKLAIALRTNDFDDEWQMEKAMEKLGSVSGVSRFGIHQSLGARRSR